MPRVALVTATGARTFDDDLPLLAAALEELGAAVTTPVWDDPAVDWAATDLAVVRSTWDYTTRRSQFVAWAERVSEMTELRNPAAVLRWNTDKRYLAELGAAGVPVVPTTFATTAEEVVLPEALEVVVKPSVSAGSRDTARYRTDRPERRAQATAHAMQIIGSGRTAMIQPYLARIDAVGETALAVVGGAVSHTLVKRPLLRPGAAPRTEPFAPEELEARSPTEAELTAADAALGACRDLLDGAPLLYARVDLIPGPDGTPRLLELELTEPSLFHAHVPGSAARFAQAILDVLD